MLTNIEFPRSFFYYNFLQDIWTKSIFAHKNPGLPQKPWEYGTALGSLNSSERRRDWARLFHRSPQTRSARWVPQPPPPRPPPRAPSAHPRSNSAAFPQTSETVKEKSAIHLRPQISIHLKDSSRPEIIIIGNSPAYLLDIWWRWFTSPKSHKNFNAVYVNLPYSSDLIICLWADDTATYRLLSIVFFFFYHRVMLCVNLNGESIYAQQNSDL